MSDESYWLARDGVVYGPYPSGQLHQMLSADELLESDQLCADGREEWKLKEAWVKEQGQPQHKPGPKASTAQKKYMKALGLPTPRGMTMAEARETLSAAIDGGARERQREQQDLQARLSWALNLANGDRGHGHPFKYVRKEVVADAIAWLDEHAPGWDADRKKDWVDYEPFKVFDMWLAPAIAGIQPSLIKESYLAEFGEGRKWRVLGP